MVCCFHKQRKVYQTTNVHTVGRQNTAVVVVGVVVVVAVVTGADSTKCLLFPQTEKNCRTANV